MFLGKVIGDASDESTGDGQTNRMKVVQKLDLYRNPSGSETIVFDTIGADDGDIVIVGSTSAGDKAPIKNLRPEDIPGDTMIMGILDASKKGIIKKRAPTR